MANLDDLLESPTPKLTEDYEPTSAMCSFVTGAAGTGKTFTQKQLILESPKYGVLCATTGIAAINLGATTLNSLLGYFDTESLRDRLTRGSLARKLHGIGKRVSRLVVDEVSMLDGRQLDYIFKGVLDANTYSDMAERPLGIVLTGDFCQLPPIKAPYAFESDCWEHFERNTTKLTRPWRQDNLEFLNALNAARAGRGKECVGILQGMGVRFLPTTVGKFQGTTIMAKNEAVDNFNYASLLDLPGVAFGLKRDTWLLSGQAQPSEWNNIPELLRLKEGAYVMILSNDTTSGLFEYANGDCGTIQSKDEAGTIWIKLARNQKLVGIRPIVRNKTIGGDDAEKLGLDAYFEGEEKIIDLDSVEWNNLGLAPSPALKLPKPRTTHSFCEKDCAWDSPGIRPPWGFPSYHCPTGRWNVGGVKYYPLRLAYATTVHKSQGLTLDACQIDCRDRFFGSPNMAYVALSRCRSASGLVIVGEPSKLAERIKIEPKVIRWL